MATSCEGCGACCRKYPLFASKADAEREPRIRAEATALAERAPDEARAYELHRLPGREECIFQDQNHHCRIYETRPAMCRGFIPSPRNCQEARARLAGPAQ